ncbi:MAG: NapC/NirT family cytochrome c [Firmicutes bacterium]|nr:NapC/NirT family cytochrome c [Bacillota bacterium]
MTKTVNIFGFLRGILENIRLVLDDPSADATLTLVVIAMLLLSLVLLGMIGYLIYSYATRDRLRLKLKVPVSESAYDVWLQRLIVVAVILIILFAGSYYTGQPKFCANCHSLKKEAKALEKSAHAGIKCLSCHQPPGITGAIAQKVDYARWFWVYAITNKANPGKARIEDAACLKCHSEVRQKTLSRYGIRVSHKEFLDAGADCMDCHNSVAHAGLIKPETVPSMSACVKCHNDKTAKADCSLCHEKDIGEKIRTPKRDLIKTGIFVNWDFCYRCHQPQKCTNCHGLQMPHPPNWVSEVKHALPAFTNPNVCFRCHDMPYAPLQASRLQGCTCHGTMEYHGTFDEWRKQHGPIATGKIPGNGENENCYSCHSEKLCDYCHPVGKYKVVPRQQDGNITGSQGSPHSEE